MTRPLDPVTAPLPNPNPNQVSVVQVPAATNIDQNAGVNNASATPAPVTTTTATTTNQLPSLGAPGGANGNYSLDQMLAQPATQVQTANVDVANVWDQIKTQQATIDKLAASTNPLDQQKLASATSTLNALYTSLSAAESRLEAANTAYSQVLLKGIDTVQLTPEQKQLYQAQADNAKAQAAQANANAKVITDGSEGQRALTAAQAGLASANAASAEATAKATAAKTPAEIAQLNAQAAALTAQANSTNALLPGLAAKQTAETNLTVAQTALTDANSDLARANATSATADAALKNAQAKVLVPAQAGLATAQTQAVQATIEQNKLGPMYGLQDRLNAIRAIQDQVFGPGGSGDAAEANKMLQDYVAASVAGTTPYEASVAAANAGQNVYTTQAALTNATQAAAASRANAYLGAGANVLGTLAQMNANAPAGSTAGAGAWLDVMRALGAQSSQGVFAPPTQPTAPALPAILARFAGGGATQPNAGAQPINININSGTGSGSSSGAGTGTGAPVPAPAGPQNQGLPAWFGQTPTNSGVASSAGLPSWLGGESNLPGVLAQHAPATTNSVMSNWANELKSGVVQLPSAFTGAM